MARFTSDYKITFNGVDITPHVYEITERIDSQFFTAMRGPGDPGYDPDYDPVLDKLGWDDEPTGGHAPEVAASPYKPSDRSWQAQQWRTDAIRRESWKRQDAGTYGAFSEEEMEQARALAGVHRPDLVAEILGHPSDVDPDAPSKPSTYIDQWHHTATFTFTIDPAPFQKVMQHVTDLTGAFSKMAFTVDEVRKAYDLPIGIVADTPRPSLNRLRHGAAAVCPRHGETRGGTCMKCAPKVTIHHTTRVVRYW